MKIRSAVPENGCLIFCGGRKKNKNKNKKTSVKHIRIRQVGGCVNYWLQLKALSCWKPAAQRQTLLIQTEFNVEHEPSARHNEPTTPDNTTYTCTDSISTIKGSYQISYILLILLLRDRSKLDAGQFFGPQPTRSTFWSWPVTRELTRPAQGQYGGKQSPDFLPKRLTVWLMC